MLRLLLLLAVVAACAESTQPQVLAGNYDLRVVDGTPVPVQIAGDWITRGTLTLDGSGRFDVVEVDSTTLGAFPFRFGGAWTAEPTFSMTPDPGFAFSAALDGDAIVLRHGGHVYSFGRP